MSDAAQSKRRSRPEDVDMETAAALDRDLFLYGVAFISKGRRVDPADVSPAEDAPANEETP